MRVVIVGGGSIGVELARILTRRKSNEVVLLEADEARSREISSELDALVLHGDGTHPEMLEKARLSEADALVALTGSDPINTVIAMLGHRADVPRIVVKVDDVGLRAACKEIGVTDIISPKLAAAARIVSVLYGFHRLDFSLVSRGDLELAEIAVGKAAGRKLSEVETPDAVLVVAILRGQETLLARRETKLEENDNLLVLCESAEARDELRDRLNAES